MNTTLIGIMGGSGLYQMEGLENIREHVITTPLGSPSDVILTGDLDGIPVAFLARHGRSHNLIPSEVPYQANILAMKQIGVKYLLSISAVGSLRETFRPRDIVIPDQYIDLTRQRNSSFFGQGSVAHVSMAEPVCPCLHDLLLQAATEASLQYQQTTQVHRGGTYVCIEGPQFSSKAESHWYRSMGADLIGMTNMPEAKLAKEAQIAYASLAMVTDYDCWHPHEATVTADAAIANLKHNAAIAQHIARKAIRLINNTRPISAFHTALQYALVTPLHAMNLTQRQIVETLLA